MSKCLFSRLCGALPETVTAIFIFNAVLVYGAGDLQPYRTLNHGVSGPRIPIGHENNYFGYSVVGLGSDRFVVGTPRQERVTFNSGFLWEITNNVGRAYLYDTNGQLIASIGNPYPGEGDQFGFAVASIGSEYFVVGAPYYESNRGSGDNYGHVFIFDRAGNHVDGISSSSGPNNLFGHVLSSLSTNRILVGVPLDDTGASDAGRVFIYDLSGTLQGSVTNPTPAAGDFFGYSVAAVGSNRFVVGAHADDTKANNAGRAYLYTSTGALIAHIAPAHLEAEDRFGWSAAGVGTNRFVIGAFEADFKTPTTTNSRAGRVYIFDQDGGLLNQLENPEPEVNAEFGYSLSALGNDRFLVGARGRGTYAGRVYLFSLDGELLAAIHNPAPANFDYFGFDVAGIGVDRFVVGAPGDDANEQDAGSAYLYHAPVVQYTVGFEIPKPTGLNLNLLPASGPDLEPADAAFWHNSSKKLYATKPGKIVVGWKQDPNPTINVEGFSIWSTNSADYQIHVANTAPVDLSADGAFNMTELIYQDAGMGTVPAAVQFNHRFEATNTGRSLLRFAANSATSDAIFFQLLRTVAWDDTNHLYDANLATPGQQNAPATIGQAVTNHFGFHNSAGGGPFVYWQRSRYCAAPGFHDRATHSGPVVPVNLDEAGTVQDDLVLIYYQQTSKLIDGASNKVTQNLFWPWKPVRYTAQWPTNAPKIIIASLQGSTEIDPVAYPQWDIYYQNDPLLPGFNPNDEHALRRPFGAGEAIFALRDDLGSPTTSQPYVLMKYVAAPGQGGLKVFKVVAQESPYFFNYPGTAGDLIQPPFPLSTLQLSPQSQGVSGPYWKDRKLSFWARAAGNDGGLANIVMRFFYPVQIGFFFPGPNPPAPGTHVPWLDLRAGTPGVPHNITYGISWPPVPELRVGETLVKPKAGLPDISLQTSVEIIYQQSVASGSGASVQLIDPTREIEVDLAQLPADAVTSSSGGQVYFPTLPPHLRNRFRYDPINHKLKFRGELIESVAGQEPYYLLLNVITPRERTLLLGLSSNPAFQTAVQALATSASNVTQIGPDTAHDSLALTAGFAQGTGYVTLAFGNSTVLSAPAEPISLEVIRVACPVYKGELKVIESENPFDEKLTLRHSGDFAGRPGDYIFEWRTLPPDPNTGLPPTAPPDQWSTYTPKPASGQGAVDITIEGPGLFTLSDNYFVCRYHPTNPANPCGTGWSAWTDPMLAPGWIKRVLTGINPFEQKIKSYNNTTVNTIVSMLGQAGTRWIGNVPLNLEAADEFGLIEIYETVLKRGIGLSIEGAPPVSYPPANDALLLAAGRIADLYMLLGNEAYADASDPTIAFGTDDGTYGSEASSLHCFMNQTASLLEEELALLRGRDDQLLPSVRTYPFYNRLIWNFTGDINGGEVAYALNYNIQDQSGNVDGTISEADARKYYPQGHGDAWGHYLTAIKNYYRLLRNTNFAWVPRIEAVLVGGVPVSVDFLDERKFAQAAAARARTGGEIVNLTYRQYYVEDPEGQYQGYQDSDPDRAWGLAEWGSRAGQGTLFDWVIANAMLPEKDMNPQHSGIQKVDRTTVTELRDILSSYMEIQAQVDLADLGQNPLGLAKNVVPFDIDPAGIAQGKTHFEQIFDRSIKAMNNAIAVFNHANNSTQLLRRQADQVSEFQQTVGEREADFNNRLIEVFGYPYADDIGPVGTYPTGYQGPDIYHFDYVDPSELLGKSPQPSQTIVLQMVEHTVNNQGALSDTTRNVTFHISTTGLGLIKPSSWTGIRRAPGEIQMARSELLQTKARFERSLLEYDNLLAQIESQAALLQAQYDLNAAEIKILDTSKNEQQSLDDVIIRSRQQQLRLRNTAVSATWLANAAAEALPLSVGLANDATSVARGALQLAGALAAQGFNAAADSEGVAELEHQLAKDIEQAQANIDVTTLRNEFAILQQIEQLKQLVRQEAGLRLEIFTGEETLRQSSGHYLAALARGQRLLEDRLRFRMQTAAQVQNYRYKDMAFRIFRNDALQKYRAQFDLAARYVYLAARAYDYETNLREGDARGPGQDFMTSIVRSRSLGLIQNGLPLTGSGQGDAGLADPLARMFQNWDLVLEGQLGFNNPQTETGRFSLRSELFRIQSGLQGKAAWREALSRQVVPNVLSLEEFQRFCIPFQPQQPVEPAILIPFSTTINFGHNFFGWPAGGGDNDYDSTHFATKIRSVGVWFGNYNNLGGGMINTPRVYLIPVGSDIMRSPSSLTGETREWKILDQALPVPFPLSSSGLANPNWIPLNDTLVGSLADVRRYARFRAYHDAGVFDAAETSNDTRLIGRSVWNTRWLLIIPGGTLHSDRNEGIQRFIHGALLPNGTRDGNGVTDIKIFFQTYAYSGN
jgi:hypothetical protein